MIVLNGEPFTRYNLRALYPFAHQIIVVEGASQGAAGIATNRGHSRDGTLEILRNFQTEEDPEDKIVVVTAEDEGHPDGFWPGEKDEMSRAYAKRATGDYLWQVDVDEFYLEEDMSKIVDMIDQDPEIAAISFPQITFWGGFDYITDGFYLKHGWLSRGINRVFKWGPGYNYLTHRPPTVINEKGENLHQLKWMDKSQTKKKNVFMYHYSLVFPKQVNEKCDYYGNAQWAKREQAKKWALEVFDKLEKPFRVHNVYQYLSWLERYNGKHPSQIESLRSDIIRGKVFSDLRQTADIERLIDSPVYRIGRTILKLAVPGYIFIFRLKRILSNVKKNLLEKQ